ncbi:MAG: hypothetical protein A2Y21_08220 [Clostridiales bacterium GWC2_40_7]|nr:MAG: hypothetical protein A2Y21_08220 [Clostridiales bacterium GWC2_40_7]
MRCGRFLGFGYNGSIILALVLILAVILFYFLIRDYFNKKSNPNNIKFLDILKQRYVQNEISSEEYMERKTIIEEEKSEDFTVLILKERYAKGEIDSKEFYERLNDLK